MCVPAGTQACWLLVSVFCYFYWLAFLIQEQWRLRIFLSISLLIPMTILFILRKNVQLVKSQSEFISLPMHLWKSIYYWNLYWCKFIHSFFFCGSDLLGPNTAAYAIVVFLGLIITVDGWSENISNQYPDFMIGYSIWWYLKSFCFGFYFSFCRIIALVRETHDTLWLFFCGEFHLMQEQSFGDMMQHASLLSLPVI